MRQFTLKTLADFAGVNPHATPNWANRGVIRPAPGSGDRGVPRLFTQQEAEICLIIAQIAPYSIDAPVLREIAEVLRSGEPAYGDFQGTVAAARRGEPGQIFIRLRRFAAPVDPGGDTPLSVAVFGDIALGVSATVHGDLGLLVKLPHRQMFDLWSGALENE